MAWSSAIFQQAALNPILGRCWTTAAPTTYGSLSADAINVALFGNISPDKTVAVGSTGYNTGVWTTGSEVTSTNWAAGGIALTGKAFAVDSGSSSVCFTAANTPGGGTVTLTAFYGALVYDATIAAGNTVAKQGLCFNYFGGSNTVTSGTFCTTGDTEILTERGWLHHDEVTAGDSCLTLNTETGNEEWQPVEAVHVFQDGPYDVIRMEGPSHSSVTTLDHRWPAVTPGAGGIGWFTTRTLPQDGQLCISASERTDKIADLSVTEEQAPLVWCVQTPNRTWFARHNGTHYFTGNTILWATPASAAVTAVFNIAV